MEGSKLTIFYVVVFGKSCFSMKCFYMRIHTRLEIGKTQSYAAKTRENRIDELSYQPEKLYTEALLQVLSKTIVEEINTTLKNECMVCFDPAV